MSQTLSPSLAFGRFQVLREWTDRSSASVLLAEDQDTHRQVIVKSWPLDAGLRETFLTEAKRLTKLEHDHLVPILDAGERDGNAFLVMDQLRGETLQTRLKREHRLSLKESLRIAREIAEGLGCLHAEGILHRDLAPKNVWIEPSGRARLLGLANVAADDSGSLLSRLDGPGTPGYLAPEQASGETITPAADLFSLGCLLYQMTTGEPPFEGESSAALLRAAVFDHPAPARDINPDLPEDLEDLLSRLLAKMPVDRPTSAADVERRLTEWLDPLAPSKPRPPKLPEAIDYPASKRILETIENLKKPLDEPAPAGRIEIRAPLPAPPMPPPPRRDWLPDLFAAFLLLAGAIGLFMWWRASNAPPPAPPPPVQNVPPR